jgi:hypothetical protein
VSPFANPAQLWKPQHAHALLQTPGPCGFQTCLWCFNNIREKGNSLCPACRAPYVEANFDFSAPDAEALKKEKAEALNKKEAEAEAEKEAQRVKARRAAGIEDRECLRDVRVLQRNLVYAVGLSAAIAREDILRSKKFFGQFGKIVKVAVNRNNIISNSRPSFSSYITYRRKDDAYSAIKALNGSARDGLVVRCTFGSTKYCSKYSRSAQAAIECRTQASTQANTKRKRALTCTLLVSAHKHDPHSRFVPLFFPSTILQLCIRVSQQHVSTTSHRNIISLILLHITVMHQECHNNTCLYLHDVADPADCFSKEDLQVCTAF